MRVDEPYWIYAYTPPEGEEEGEDDGMAMVGTLEYLQTSAEKFIEQGKEVIIGEGPIFHCHSKSDLLKAVKDMKGGN